MFDEEISQILSTLERLSEPLNHDIYADDNAGIFPHEKWRLLSDIGLFSIVVDEKYGGLGFDLVSCMRVLEKLGYICEDGGLNFSIATQIITAQIPIQIYGSDFLKEQYLGDLASGTKISAHGISEPDSGSDAYAMKSKAEKKSDGYRLNGSKIFVSNGPIADLLVVYARTGKGSIPLANYSAMLVEKSAIGFSIGKSIDKMGLRTSPFCELFFDDCLVSESHIIGKEGKGFGIMETVSAWEIFCIAALQLGEIENLLSRCISYARERKQFGKAIGENQAVSHKIADIKIALELAKAKTYQAARLFHEGKKNKADISVVKVATSEAYVKAAEYAVQIFGGYGYTKEYDVERYLRNSVASKIYSGPNDVHRNIIYSFLSA